MKRLFIFRNAVCRLAALLLVGLAALLHLLLLTAESRFSPRASAVVTLCFWLYTLYALLRLASIDARAAKRKDDGQAVQPPVE